MVPILRKVAFFLMVLPVAAAAQTLPVANGGTGGTSAGTALSNVLGNPAAGTYVVTCPDSAHCAPASGGSGGGMVYPPGTGIPSVLSGSSWAATLGLIGSGSAVLAPSGTSAAGSYIDGASFAWTPLPFQSLTTSGSSGPASLSAGILNIPNYAGGGTSLTPCSSGNPFVTYVGGTPGCSVSSAATQRGIDAGVVGGLSTSATDNSGTFETMMQTYCQTTACEIWIDCSGNAGYKFSHTPQVPVTAGTYRGVKIIAEGTGSFNESNCVEFEGTGAGNDGLWWDNTSSGAGNNSGPIIEGITFVDGTTAATCNAAYGANSVANHPGAIPGSCMQAGIRITQTNYGILRHLGFQQFGGIWDWNGANNGAGTQSITVVNGSTAFSCSPSCSFPTAAAFGNLWVQGETQEIQTLSGNAGTLTSKWEYPSYTGTNWNIDWGGVLHMVESSSVSGCTTSSDCFAQYWIIDGDWGWYGREAFDFVGGPTACSQGTSAINIYGGAFRGEHNPDTIGLGLYKCSDTVTYNDVAQNDYAFHVVIENGHAHKISGRFENGGTIPVVYSCNGGVASNACVKIAAINCEANGECQNNTFENGYAYLQGSPNGTGFEFNNDTIITGDQIQGFRIGGSINPYKFNSGRSVNTQTAVTIVEPDAVAFMASCISVHGVTWCTGSGAPSGSCQNGSFYSNTSGGAGTAIYGCYGGVYHDIL